MDTTIEFFNTTIAPTAIDAVSKTLQSTRISAGANADLFETDLSNYGLINPVTVNSGTVTMHLALMAAGVGPGDEVIIPAQTFIATGMAVLYVGATPVFADINLYDGNISLKSIIEKITDKTKAKPNNKSSIGALHIRVPIIASGLYITMFLEVNHQLVINWNGRIIA